MLPYLTIFSKQIPVYGLLILVGSVLGVLYACYARRDTGIARQDIFFAACYAGIGVFVGAKTLYIALTLPELLALGMPLTLPMLYELFAYGFVFYGGALGGMGAVYWYARKYQLSYLILLEALIPSVPLIHAFGRLGCFFAGCCYGKIMPPPWGVYFEPESVAPQGVSLLPVQLYEAAFNLLLFAALAVYASRRRAEGRVLGLYLAAYAPARFILEFFRFDASRGFLWGLSTSQWIGLVLLPIGMWLLLRKPADTTLCDSRRT